MAALDITDIIVITTNLRRGFDQNDEIMIAKYAKHLGEYYLTQTDPDLCTYRYAAIAFNAALKRLNNSDETHTDEITDTIHKIEDIKRLVMLRYAPKRSCTSEHFQELTSALSRIQQYRRDLHSAHKNMLKEIRDTLSLEDINSFYTKQVEDIDVTKGLEKINVMFTEIFIMYQYIVKEFSTVIFNIIGDPPCSYALCAVGSLGKGMPSDRSDFDLVLLIESEEHREFFKLYSLHLCLFVIDLQETPLIRIRSKDMEWMFHCCEKDKEGISVDVGGIPIEYGGKILLIGEPSYIVSVQSEIEEKYFPLIKASMYCPRVLIGDSRLLSEYQRLNHIHVKEDTNVSSYTELRQLLEATKTEVGEVMYIKFELVRPPFEGLVRLARIYDIPSTNPLEIVSSLVEKELIRSELVGDIERLFFWVSYYMLRNYNDYKAQMQKVLLHSQILPPNSKAVVLDPGRVIKSSIRSFCNSVVVSSIKSSNQYHLDDDKRIKSEDMRFIQYIVYLLFGMRYLLQCFVDQNFDKIRSLTSLTIDPNPIFDFSVNHERNHLSKNGINAIRHKTNYLYLHLITYYQKFASQCRTSYIENNDKDAMCLVISSGIALISTALKMFQLEAGHHIINEMVDIFVMFEKSSNLTCTLDELKAFDKRLPTLYAQFLFFRTKVLLFNTIPDQKHTSNVLHQATTYIEMATHVRTVINCDEHAHYDDHYNDGSDDILISLYGSNFPKIASSDEKNMRIALASYRNYLGRDDVTDVACYTKIFKLELDLMNTHDTHDIHDIEKIEKECQHALNIAHRIESSITGSLYIILGKLSYYRNKNDVAKEMFTKSCQIEFDLNRTDSVTIREANLFLQRMNVKTENNVNNVNLL